MAAALLVLFLSVIYETNSQLCPGPYPLMPPQNFCPCPAQILPLAPVCQEIIGPFESVVSQPVCSGGPLVATTIIDNTVSNSLANAIQLLIVSNLIENTLNAGLCPSNIVPFYDTVLNPPCSAIDTPVEVYPMNPVLCEAPVIEPILCEPQHPYVQEIIPMQQFAPYCQGFPYPEFAGPCISPVASEVLFPSSIPAQLTCNFGYMNTNVPCVSVNVEPAPYDCCSSMFSNGPILY